MLAHREVAGSTVGPATDRRRRALGLLLGTTLTFGSALSPGGVHATAGGNGGRSISGASPFTCNPFTTLDDGHYHLEYAPSVAVNPADTDNIAVAWIQDDFEGIVVGFTHDGGDTWAKREPPMSGHCSGLNDFSVTNPRLSFGPKGRLYLSYCVCPPHEFWRTRIQVQVSTDGGANWDMPVSLEENLPVLKAVDWSWVVADPTQTETAYAVWQRFDDSDPSNGRNVEMRFARTIDGGATWSAPRDISSPAPPDQSRWYPRIVALPDGSLVNIFHQIFDCPVGGSCFEGQTVLVMAARSTDQGESWSEPVRVAKRENFSFGGNQDHERVAPLENEPVEPPALSSDGAIYYAWSSIEPDGSSKLYLTSSSDGGVTWDTEKVIRESDVPMASAAVGVAGGKAGVLFYDFRNDVPNDGKETADVWFISAPRVTQGAWGLERHVAGPFDVSSIPLDSNDLSVHSNQTIARVPGGLVSAYTLGAPLSTKGPTDIFFSRIRN